MKKLLSTLALAATLASPVMADDFTIGAVNAKTGFMAAYDAPFMQGVHMYMEDCLLYTSPSPRDS